MAIHIINYSAGMDGFQENDCLHLQSAVEAFAAVRRTAAMLPVRRFSLKPDDAASGNRRNPGIGSCLRRSVVQ
ncbi:MAG: hypothetical protein HKN42_13800 [Granulosicoccus sp.]|nr:hypothetical protein [Granulosicoccus sp.]